jgi:hypothetical protein
VASPARTEVVFRLAPPAVRMAGHERVPAVRAPYPSRPASAGPIAALVLASLLWGTADVQDVRVGGRCFGALTGFLVSGRKP